MRIGVLVSGRGSNLAAILEAAARGVVPEVALVVSNVATCPALEIARRAGVATRVVDPAAFAARPDHDRAVAAALGAARVELVCLAGYVRLIGAPLIEPFAGRILNVHPSLLPAFPGLHAQRQALERGVRIAGCTVHFVDAGMDSGPIIAQAAVPVLPDDSEESLAARILVEEHRLFPAAIRWIAEGRVRQEGRRAVWTDGPRAAGALESPSPGVRS